MLPVQLSKPAAQAIAKSSSHSSIKWKQIKYKPQMVYLPHTP